MKAEASDRKARIRRREKRFARIERYALPLIVPVVRLWAASWRFRFEEAPLDEFRAWQGPRAVAALHGDIAILLGAGARFGAGGKAAAVLNSPSRDGRVMARACERLGFRSVIGSTSKGGAAGLKALVSVARDGHPVVLTVDGPKGPLGDPKPGVLLLARMSKARLYTVAFRARPAVRLGSWDRLALPAPFARIRVGLKLFHDYGEGRHGGDERSELARQLREGVVALGGDVTGFPEPGDGDD